MLFINISLIGLSLLVSLFLSFYAYRSKRLNAIFKPIPLTLLSVTYLINLCQANAVNCSTLLILWGLLFGLLGDIFLLNEKKFFIFGLLSFLIGHIFYILKFFSQKKSLPILSIGLALVLLIAFVYGLFFFRKVSPQTRRQFFLPIVVYMLTLSLMLVSAFNFDYQVRSRFFLFTIGGLLFFISDAVLAWTVFIQKYAASDTVIYLTYFTAQILITTNAILLL